MVNEIICVFLFIVGISLVGSKEHQTRLPSPAYFPTCYRDDPDADSCVKDFIEKVLPHLSKGAEELEVPPLDPHYVDFMYGEYFNYGVFGNITLTDITTYGLGGLRMDKVRTILDDPARFKIHIDGFFKTLRCTGFYDMFGSILTFPVGVKGDFNASAVDLPVEYILKGVHVHNNNTTFIKINRFDAKPRFDKIKIVTSDIFPGNPELSRMVLGLINRHWNVIYDEARPYIEYTMDKVLRNFANRILLRVPYDEIAPLRKIRTDKEPEVV